MKVLKNQIIYECEYCGKRLLSRNGAKIHEIGYCKAVNSIHQKDILLKQRDCSHNNITTIWDYIPGEAVKEPQYELCIDCDKKL